MTFGEPIQLTPPAAPAQPEIKFGPPEQLERPQIKFDAPEKAQQFAPPVDIFAEDAPIELFEQWKKQQPDVSAVDRVVDAGAHLLKGAWAFTKFAAKQSGRILQDQTDLTLGDKRGEASLQAVKDTAAFGAETVAEAYKASALTGEFLKQASDRADNVLAETVSTDANERTEVRHRALRAERRFIRLSRELGSATNDGRLIADNIFQTVLKTQENNFNASPVDTEAAQFAGNFVADPALAGNLATAIGRKALAETAAKVAVRQFPMTGELAYAERELATALARQAENETTVVAARSAGADASALEVMMAKDLSAVQEANLKFQRLQTALREQEAALALESQFGKSAGQVGLGKVVEAAGNLANKGGDLLDSLHAKISAAAEAVSKGDVTGAGILSKAAQKVTPDFLKEGTADFLHAGGDFAREAGRLMSAKQSSLPYFQSLARALPDGTVGRWAASQAERVEFLAQGGRWLMDSADASARGAGVGAAFGLLNGDPAGGAAQGALFGFAGSQYGQFRHFNSPAEVFMQQQVDIELARQRAQRRGPEDLKQFEALSPGSKLFVATLEQAHPDLFINLKNKDGVSWYDFNGSVGEIGLDPKNPIAGALTHEVKHHLGRNPEIAQAVETQLLGDPDAGIPGLFTARDKDGKPIVLETKDAENPGAVRREFQLNEEFYKLRGEYLQRIADKGLHPGAYERSNKLIAHEIWAESETANVLGRQANGIFDSVAVERMGAVRKKLSELVEGSELVSNSAFLQRVLAKAGIVFDAFGGTPSNTGLFSDSLRIPGMTQLVKKYYEKSDRERQASGDSESYGARHYTEAEILASPELTELFSSGFDVVRDPANGKLRFVTDSEAKVRQKDFVDTLQAELKANVKQEPGDLREVEQVDSTGRKSKVWMGTKVPEAVVAKMEATGRFNEYQLQTLRMLSKTIPKGLGNEVFMYYQPATKRGGAIYRTRPITERTETPMAIHLTKDGNIVINTISQEKLQRNAVALIKSGKAPLWPGYQELWADVQTYLQNHANGLAGDATIGSEKRDVINSLFGQLTKDQREANPFLQETPEKKARNAGIVQSRRLDRINKAIPLSTTFKPDYSKVSRNFSPSSTWDQAHDHSPGLIGTINGDEVSSRQSPLNNAGHASFGMRGDNNWRYNPKTKTLYFWEKPTPEQRELVTDHVEAKKFVVNAVKQIGDNDTPTFNEAHGGNQASRLIVDGVEGEWHVRDALTFSGVHAPFETKEEAETWMNSRMAAKAKRYSPGKKDRVEGAMKQKELELVHFSGNPDIKATDPKRLGSSGITGPSERRGLNRSFFFVKGSKYEGGVKDRPYEYHAKVEGSKIYDGVKDPLDYWGMINREKADRMLIDRGFTGIYAEDSRNGRKIVQMFEVTPVTRSNTAESSKGRGRSGVVRPTLGDTDTQYSPGVANPFSRQVAHAYAKSAGIDLRPHEGYDELPEAKVRRIADYFDQEAKHDPSNPEVAASYAALARETKAQYEAMVKAGVTIEPFTGKGEPYKNSLEMMADVRDNKHLSFFLTDSGFGSEGGAPADNPMLRPSGVKIGDRELLVNDLFRAVHDFFGHTQQGFQFGPRGEFNAWKEHSRMFSETAQGALAAETLAQNAWVNFGEHLRDAEGNIPKKGEPGFVAPQDRPFAEQKTFVLPDYLRQFSPGPGDDTGLRISTRVPTAVKATEDALASQLSIKRDDVLRDYETSRTIAQAIKKYPNIPAAAKTPKEALQALHDQAVDNLIWLHDKMDPELRERAKLWYDGARKLTEDWSKKYEIPRQGVAGVLASLSPQKDWFMNVDLGRRVIEHQKTLADRDVTEGVVDWFRGKFGDKKPELLEALELNVGRPFDKLGLLEKAIVLRAYDEIAADRGYQIITPEGDFSGPAQNMDGRPSRVAWGDFNTIAKALSIVENPSRQNVSEKLGQEHKVRSFYNNILLPKNAEHGDVTIDTHAVAAALLRPLSGSSIEVMHNFGSGVPSSAITGASGLYGLYADAYRAAAAERGRLPREMQSITWEAVRGLFPAEFKTQKNQDAIDAIWNQYKKGTITLDDARAQVYALAGGIEVPSWAGSGR